MYNVVELWLLLQLLQGGFISVHGLRGYGPSHWGSTTEGTQAEAAGRIVPTLLETEEDDAATQLSVPFLFSLGRQPMGWCQSHARWGFPSLLSLSGNAVWHTPRGVFSMSSQI